MKWTQMLFVEHIILDNTCWTIFDNISTVAYAKRASDANKFKEGTISNLYKTTKSRTRTYSVPLPPPSPRGKVIPRVLAFRFRITAHSAL